MTDKKNINTSGDDLRKDSRQRAIGISTKWLAANSSLIIAIACFTALEIGFITDITRLGEELAQLSLILFMCGMFVVFIVARFLPWESMTQNSKRSGVALIVISILLWCVLVLLGLNPFALSGLGFMLLIASCSFLTGALACTGLLKCYNLINNMGDKSPRSLLVIALISGIALFIVIYWLEDPVKTIAFSLLCALGHVAVILSNLAMNAIPTDQSVDSLIETQVSEYLNNQSIHLNRYTHMLMFSLHLALGYCIGIAMRAWTPLSVSIAAIVSILVCLIYHQLAKRYSIALGELGKVALPVCMALLFCVAPNIQSVNGIVATIAMAAFLPIETLNVYWLVKTSALFNLSAAKHVAAGRLPLVIGTICGVIISLFMQQVYLMDNFRGEQYLLGLMVSGIVAVVLVTTYALLPFNKGTPVKEGIIYSDFSRPKNPIVGKQGKPFRELCNDYGRSNGLTPRELETLFLLACGYNSETIAQILIVSGSTARTHVYRIYQKLDIHSQQELIRKMDQLFEDMEITSRR